MKRRPLRYVFVSEVNGSTIVEQFSAVALSVALIEWHKNSQVEPGDTFFLDDPTAVAGLTAVWCMSGFTIRNDSFLTHVILAGDPSAEGGETV